MFMVAKLKSLFSIRTRVDVMLVTYAIALGAAYRGAIYLSEYPGLSGKMLFAACLVLPAIVGATLLDAIRMRRRGRVNAPVMQEFTAHRAQASGDFRRMDLGARYRRPTLSRNRPSARRSCPGSAGRFESRKD